MGWINKESWIDKYRWAIVSIIIIALLCSITVGIYVTRDVVEVTSNGAPGASMIGFGDVMPSANNTFSSGNSTHRWSDVYSVNANITGTLDAATGRTATFVVAANNSSALSKSQADYVCDGTADDVQIQAAIDALPVNGGKVELLEGNYNIAAKITIGNSTTLGGQGNGTILTLINGVNDNMLQNADTVNGNSGINICNMHLNGNKDNNTMANGGLIWLWNTRNFLITNISVINSAKIGIAVSDTSSTLSIIDNCWADSNSDNGFDLNTTGVTYVIVSNCISTNNGVGGFVLDQADNCHLLSLIANNNTGSGIVVGESSRASNDGTISNIIANSNGGSGARFINCNQSTISDIVANENTDHGVQFESCSNNTGSNINVNRNTLDGLRFDTSEDITIASLKSSKNRYGVSVIKSEDITLTAVNIGENERNGINLWGAASRLTIVGGTVKNNSNAGVGSYHGVYAAGSAVDGYSSNCTITQLHIYDDQDTATQGYGIQNTGNSSGWIITSNHLANNVSGEINVVNSNIINNNHGYVTENWGNATGTGSEQTIAHGLADTPTWVSITGNNTNASCSSTSAPDATNIYVTCDSGEAIHWEAAIRSGDGDGTLWEIDAIDWEDANDLTSTGNITALAVKSSHIDWGTGANQVDQTDIPYGARLYLFSATIIDPDGVQTTIGNITILPIEAEAFPYGVTFVDLGIKTAAASNYTALFQEWTAPGTYSSLLESVATTSSSEAEDDGTIANGTGGAAGDCNAGSILKVTLPTTDINELVIWGSYKINDS